MQHMNNAPRLFIWTLDQSEWSVSLSGRFTTIKRSSGAEDSQIRYGSFAK